MFHVIGSANFFFFTHGKSHSLFDIQQVFGSILVRKVNTFTNVMNEGKDNVVHLMYV